MISTDQHNRSSDSATPFSAVRDVRQMTASQTRKVWAAISAETVNTAASTRRGYEGVVLTTVEFNGLNPGLQNMISIAAIAGRMRDEALENLPEVKPKREQSAIRQAIGKFASKVANFFKPSRGAEPVTPETVPTPSRRPMQGWIEFVVPAPEVTDRALGTPQPDGGRHFSAADLLLISDIATEHSGKNRFGADV